MSPGDIIMMTAAVRDLHRNYPGQFMTDIRTSCPALWENNPYVVPLDENDPDVEVIDCEYPLVHESNQLPIHFIHAYRMHLSEKLNLAIRPGPFRGDIHLTEEERSAPSRIAEITGLPGVRFWIIAAGGKTDFTAKWWDTARCQAVVDHFAGRLLFVQCGADHPNHVHNRLRGVVNMVGKTDLRQIVRLMHHADGVLCPVTMFMHLAAAVETKVGRSINRPCVVWAGGREPTHWEAYPHHRFLHTIGCLPCCEEGGCWRSRVVPLNDGKTLDERLCRFPVVTRSGSVLPKCMDMITADDVIEAVEDYLQYSTFALRAIDRDFADEPKPANHVDGSGRQSGAARLTEAFVRSISSLER